MRNTGAKGPSLRRTLRITLFTGGVIVVLVVAVLGAWLIDLSSRVSFGPPPNDGPLVVTTSIVSADKNLDFFVSIRNSGDQPITLQSMTLESGIPSGVVLLHSAVMLFTDDGCCEYTSDTQWPPRVQQGNTFTLHPLKGFVLMPYTPATLVYAVRVDTPGTYVLGPVTARGTIPVFGGSGLLSFPVARTYRDYSILCYSGQADCTQALQSI